MPRYPTGWFGLVRSSDLPKGAVKKLHYFGKDLIAFRDVEGRATVTGAFCPHYGAHLGVGGRVIDGTVECPFHGWRFGAEGRCVHAPFAESVPKVSLDVYPVQEHSGLIFVWHGESAPTWEVPRIPEVESSDFGPPVLRSYESATHIQEMRENIVDESHFHFIHKQAKPPSITFETDGPFAYANSTIRNTWLGVRLENDFRASMAGPGVMVVRSSGRWFNLTAIALTNPINAQTSELRMTYLIAKLPRFEFTHPLYRLVFGLMTDREVSSEIEIWNHKIFVRRPIFLRHETSIRNFRRWYTQFYPPAAMAPAER